MVYPGGNDKEVASVDVKPNPRIGRMFCKYVRFQIYSVNAMSAYLGYRKMHSLLVHIVFPHPRACVYLAALASRRLSVTLWHGLLFVYHSHLLVKLIPQGLPA